MAAGYKDFTAGAVLTAADLEDYCVLQSLMRFASAAARTTALSAVLTEGLASYLLDVNTIGIYSGAAWSTIGPVHGALTSWTPTVTQSGAVTVTVNSATYQRIGRRITGHFHMTVTGSGTSSNVITIAGIPATAIANNGQIGTALILDNSTTFLYPAITNFASTTTFNLLSTKSAGVADLRLGVTDFTAALAANDIISGGFTYEAAGDA